MVGQDNGFMKRGDEKTAPYPPQIKRLQVREESPKKVFHGGRNFN